MQKQQQNRMILLMTLALIYLIQILTLVIFWIQIIIQTKNQIQGIMFQRSQSFLFYQKANLQRRYQNHQNHISSILKDLNTNDNSSLDSSLKAELGLTSSSLNSLEINSTSKKDTDKNTQNKTESKAPTDSSKDDEDSFDKEINGNLEKKKNFGKS